MINLDDKNSKKKTHLVSLFIDKNVTVYFDSFGIEYILLEVLSKIRNILLAIYLKYKIMNLLCSTFIASLSWNICFRKKTLLNYTVLFSPNKYKNNDKIIYKDFKDKHGKTKASFECRIRKIDETRNYEMQ